VRRDEDGEQARHDHLTARYYPRPGVAFVPVTDMEPSPFHIAWLHDRADPLVRDFVECAVRAADAASAQR
jgi:hypothetical protein